jgi:DNA-binding PadR family transcriptional regulator
MRRPNPKDHIPLAPHDFEILLTLLDTGMHGYSIIQEIERRTDGEIEIGTSTLYAAIQRLVKAGILEETDRPSEMATDHSGRRYYRATVFGRGVARLEAERIRRLERRMVRTGVFELLAEPVGAR